MKIGFSFKWQAVYLQSGGETEMGSCFIDSFVFSFVDSRNTEYIQCILHSQHMPLGR